MWLYRIATVIATALFGVLATVHVRGLLGTYPEDSTLLQAAIFIGVPLLILGFVAIQGRPLRRLFSSKWQWIVLGLALIYTGIDTGRYARAGTQRAHLREDHGHYYISRPEQGEIEVTEATYREVDGAKTYGILSTAAYLSLASALMLLEGGRRKRLTR